MLRPLLAVLLAAPSSALAETLKLRSGQEIPGSVATIDGETVTLGDGRALPRADVREIQFAEKKDAADAAAPGADPAAAARGRELFRLADAFAAKNPGADGVQLVDEGEYVVRPDGTWVERDRFAGLILKDGLKASWGQLSRWYEEGRERVKIVRATVYHRDGSVYPFDPRAVEVSAPQAEELFFQDYRSLSYSLPQVEVGSIVEYEVETETYNPFRKDFFFPRWGFQGGSPSLMSHFSITVPAGQKLYYTASHFDGAWKKGAKPRVTTKDGATTYDWRLDEIPGIVGEPMMVPYYDYAPNVKAALFDDWGRIDDWLADMYKERLKASPELTAFTLDLIKGAKTDDDKVAAIYHYVQREVRYIAIKMGVASGWGGYAADVTWKKRYGCCIDKAILFASMLRVAGIRAEPVLLNPNDEARHDYRVPDIWFAHAITHLTVGGRDMFLDSTGSDYRYPELASFDHGVEVRDVFKRGTRTIPTPAPAANVSDYTYKIALDAAGGAVVSYGASYNGSHEGELRGYYKSLKESEQRKDFENWINGISPAAELADFKLGNLDELDKPFTIGMTYRLKDYLIPAGDLRILKLPDFEEEFSEVALAKRRYALQYMTSSERRFHYDIALPKGYAVASLPRAVRVDGPRESFRLDCAQKNERLLCDAAISRAERTYEADRYARHKSFLEKVSRLTRDRIFLKTEAPR
jgi:transglutaminase-like putative cysteine protease